MVCSPEFLKKNTKMTTKIRPAGVQDRESWVSMAQELWPDATKSSLEQEFEAIQSSAQSDIFMAEVGSKATGFIHLSIRYEHVEGITNYPAGYIEGLYVDPHNRYYHIATDLVKQAELWCQQKGCRELASDAALDNHGSHIFHSKVGFQEVSRLICYTKTLA